MSSIQNYDTPELPYSTPAWRASSGKEDKSTAPWGSTDRLLGVADQGHCMEHPGAPDQIYQAGKEENLELDNVKRKKEEEGGGVMKHWLVQSSKSTYLTFTVEQWFGRTDSFCAVKSKTLDRSQTKPLHILLQLGHLWLRLIQSNEATLHWCVWEGGREEDTVGGREYVWYIKKGYSGNFTANSD